MVRCVNYVHYYPRTELELCKSSVAEQPLHSYFQYLQVGHHDDYCNDEDDARYDDYDVDLEEA